MIPILATVLSQAANLANRNLSELKSSGGQRNTRNALSSAAEIESLKSQLSGIAQNGVV